MTDNAQALVGLFKTEPTARLSEPFNGLSRCPHCRSAKPTLRLSGLMYREINPGKLEQEAWATYQCTSCYNPINFLTTAQFFGEPSDQLRYFQQYKPPLLKMQPDGTDDFSDWPERARRYMEQAVDTLHAPDAAVMLAGSAVDAMLKEKELNHGSVYVRIEKAVKEHLLTREMGEWAHSVRLSANSPRHADIDAPHASAEEASASLDFTKALGLFLFVLPARVKRGKEAAEQAADKASDAE